MAIEEHASPRPARDTREVVHLIPHSHWDREWYLPWQRFRMRLVDLVDGLLDEMAEDERVRFTLDGQTATVDDYLEIRPERVSELSGLVAAGRLAIGPWRILMDEFLVSGESQVRNLEMGVRRATELGRVMAIGYLPDMFGHVAQMPQILRRSGIADAVVWRGVPSRIDRHVFAWIAPDGSAVRCEYLLDGYVNGRDVLTLADRIGRNLDIFVGRQRPFFGDDELLAMYGEDHSIPRPGYAELVARFNRAQERYEIRIGTLAEALAATRDSAAVEQSWNGELRSSARANVLMGVTSHRVEVKQAAGRAERLLERAVEPLWALHGQSWPAALLDQAWRRVVENSAHDSICACSAEPTVAQVLLRYAEAEQIANGLLERLLVDVGASQPTGSFIVLNPSPAEGRDVVAVEVPLRVSGERARVALLDPDGTPVPTQEDGVRQAVIREATLNSSDVVPYLRRRMHARELYGHQINGYRIRHAGGPSAGKEPQPEHALTIDVDQAPDPADLDVDELLDSLAAETSLRPKDRWYVAIVTRPRMRILALPVAPPLGRTTLTPRLDDPTIDQVMPAADAAVRVSGREVTNGIVTVHIADDGTLDIAAGPIVLRGVGRIVDGGDVGDSYNYAPPATDTVIESPLAVDVTSGRAGPLVGELTVGRIYDWPAGLVPDLSARTEETVRTPVQLEVELRAGEPFVRLAVEIDNRSVDHRVRFHVPFGEEVDRSYAEGQFAIVERGLEMEGGHGEVPLPTFPAHSFVAAGPIAALLEHVTEYELVGRRDGPATELALTLVRATGFISRDNHPYRDEPAGPVVAAPTGQAQGLRRISFALLPITGGPFDHAIAIAVDRFRHPFLVGLGSGSTSAQATSQPGLQIAGDGIVLSALRVRDIGDGRVRELRIVREAPGDGRALLEGSFGRWREADLLGRPTGEWLAADGRVELTLGGWEIRTLQLG